MLPVIRPSYIPRHVSLIEIDSEQSKPLGRTTPNGLKEGCKGSDPGGVNLDASAAVIAIFLMLLVQAPLFYLAPNLIFGWLPAVLDEAVILDGPSSNSLHGEYYTWYTRGVKNAYLRSVTSAAMIPVAATPPIT